MKKFLALAPALFYLAANLGAAVLPAEKLLPDDTMAVFTIPDFNQMRDIYQHSPQGRLWNDPAMKDFKDKFFSKLSSDYITPLEHELGVDFDDYTNLPQGQFTAAIIQNGWQGKDDPTPAFLVLLDTKDKSAQLKTNLADLKKKWVDAGKTIKTETIRDIDFSAIVLSSNDIPKTLKKPKPALPPGVPEPMENTDLAKAPKKPLYIGQAESLLIIGNSPKVIEKILARMSGGSVKPLSEVSSFDADTAMFHNAPAFGWVNVKSFVDIWSHPSETPDADSTSPFAFKPDKILPALGLNAVSTLAFNYVYTDEGARFNITLFAPEASRTGLLTILAGEAKDCNPPAFVPADVVKFQRWRLDGGKTWQSLRKIVSNISPTALGTVDFIIGSAESGAKEKDPGFDLNKNLFGNLGDDFITYQRNPRGKSEAELSAPPSLFLIGSPKPELLASTIKTLLALSGQQTGPITDREFLGHKIYSVPLPTPPGPGAGIPAAPRNLSYGFGGGYLAISLDPAMLEEYLRSSENQGKSLRDTPGLADATQKVSGSGTSLFGYSNEADSMRVFFDLLKQNAGAADPLGGAAPVAAAMGMGTMKTSDWFDVSLLPTFDKVAKYFYFSVYSVGTTPDGLTFKAFAPTPPQSKD